MRRTLIMGNWKMNLGAREAIALASSLERELALADVDADVAVCPSFPHLTEVRSRLEGSPITVGAQDCVAEEPGAVTGGVSARQIAELGMRWVILGHSERRAIFGEGDPLLARKLRTALGEGLFPVLCVGERLEEREAGDTESVVLGQLRGALEGIDAEPAKRVTIAYEPVWAIGTGRNALPNDVAEVHAAIRGEFADGFGPEMAESLRILYGGSVKAENVASYLGLDDVDGGLVGGASLSTEGFMGILAQV
jgi:triosephosphate isomerase